EDGIGVRNVTGVQTCALPIYQVDIAHATFPPSGYAERADYHKALLSQLADWNTDLIVLAGYLLKIPVPVIDAYSGRIINIHPSQIGRASCREICTMTTDRI